MTQLNKQTRISPIDLFDNDHDQQKLNWSPFQEGAQSGIVTRTYNAYGMTQEDSTGVGAGVVNHEYDLHGRLIRTFTSTDATAANVVSDTRYSYDLFGRLDAVELVKAAGGTVSEETEYRFDLLGNMKQVASPTQFEGEYIVGEYSYDRLNRLVYLVHFDDEDGDYIHDDPQEATLASFAYSLRLDGKRARADEVLDDTEQSFDWVYDELGRLTHERFDSNTINAAYDGETTYEYDLVGNRTSQERFADGGSSIFSTTYRYDINDRMIDETTTTGGTTSTTTYAFGANNSGAELTSKTTGAAVTTYTYNLQGRLANVQLPAGGDVTAVEYEYNDSGIRISSDEDGNKTVFVVASNNPTGFAQVLEERVAENVDVTYTLGHDVITQRDSNGVYNFIYDGHGATRALVSQGQPEAAAVEDIFTYDAYGNLLTGIPKTSLLYSGEFTDSATEQQYLRARYYDPATGRFNRLARISHKPKRSKPPVVA